MQEKNFDQLLAAWKRDMAIIAYGRMPETEFDRIVREGREEEKIATFGWYMDRPWLMWVPEWEQWLAQKLRQWWKSRGPQPKWN